MLRRRAPLIVGSLFILAMIAFVTLYRSSPGDLSRDHAPVAGSPLIMDCKKCHAPQGLTSACLQCHTEIRDQLTSRKGYHDYLAQIKKTECATCHSEHNGKDFELINKASWEGIEPRNFSHPEANYRLTGKHLGLACEKCHTSAGVKPFALPKFPKILRRKTYLGLSQECVRCHKDIHARGLAFACADCHSQEAWKPAPLFNHEKFFPLKGGHAGLKCSQCHIIPDQPPLRAGARTFNFKRVKGTKCIECHQNPHRARWMESCESCHKASDTVWALADKRMTRKQHALTGFRLSPPHHKAACEQCHTAGASFKVKYPDPRRVGYSRSETYCETCHKDEHRGQFVKNHPRCMDCHSRTAFMPPVYGVKNHLTYPLTGKHISAACSLCHIKDRRTGVRQYVPTPQACAVCHKDIHYGQFRKPDGSQRCEDCHLSTVGWNRLTFNHNTQSRFKLDQAHEKVACIKCHPMVTARGVRLVQYKPLRMKCRDCHDFDH